MKTVEKSIKKWIAILVTIVCYYVVHEGVHLLFALALGVFEQIRLVGIIGVQIVTTENQLNGINLALFSGVSSLVTITIGYVLALYPGIYRIKNKNLLIGIYYLTVCFLLLDPLYMSVLSKFVGGGDLNGVVTGLNTSDIPFRILFGIILIANITLFRTKVYPKYREIFKEE